MGLTRIEDFSSVLTPETCRGGTAKFEQAAAYLDNNNSLSVVRDIWQHFDNANKAALLVHETLYRSLRGIGETTSDHARRAVGLGFSGFKFEWMLAGLPSTPVLCNSLEPVPLTRFAAFEVQPGTVQLQFFELNGEVILSKTTLLIAKALSPLSSAADLSATNHRTVVSMSLKSPVVADTNLAYSIALTASGSVEFSLGTFGATLHGGQLPKMICNELGWPLDQAIPGL